MIKVSICIPAYRQVEFLRRTLESIRGQDFHDYEVIVTDDSPDDAVERLVQEFSLNGRLRYIRNPSPLGSPENWNECIRLARGELVKIMHHDDFFANAAALGKFVALMDEHPAAMFGFSATLVEDVNTGQLRVHAPTDRQLQLLRLKPHVLFAGNCIGSPSATVYRRSLGLQYDRAMKWLVDLDFYISVLREWPCFAYSPEPLISTPTNASHQVTEVCRDNAGIELFEYCRLFSKLDDSAREDLLVKETWLRILGKYRIMKLGDFRRHGVAMPVESEYFRRLLARPSFRFVVRWSIADIRQEALRCFYRYYPCLPPYVRRPLKWVRNCVLRLLRSGA